MCQIYEAQFRTTAGAGDAGRERAARLRRVNAARARIRHSDAGRAGQWRPRESMDVVAVGIPAVITRRAKPITDAGGRSGGGTVSARTRAAVLHRQRHRLAACQDHGGDCDRPAVEGPAPTRRHRPALAHVSRPGGAQDNAAGPITVDGTERAWPLTRVRAKE